MKLAIGYTTDFMNFFTHIPRLEINPDLAKYIKDLFTAVIPKTLTKDSDILSHP